jgi:hypothetical protein
MEGEKSIEGSQADVTKPLHCVAGLEPSQSVHKFSSIRFFSNFDSGNLLKVGAFHSGRVFGSK